MVPGWLARWLGSQGHWVLSKRSWVSFQPPAWQLTTVSLVPRDLLPSFAPAGHLTCVCCTNRCVDKTSINIKIKIMLKTLKLWCVFYRTLESRRKWPVWVFSDAGAGPVGSYTWGEFDLKFHLWAHSWVVANLMHQFFAFINNNNYELFIHTNLWPYFIFSLCFLPKGILVIFFFLFVFFHQRSTV